MCSFLLSSFLLPNITAVFNARMQLRGPDFTSRLVLNGISFVHNLLHLTGPRTPQPFIEPGGRAAVVFNGEVYNYIALAQELDLPSGTSDGAVLLPAYRRWGPSFLRRIDGEFALALVDFEDGRLLLASDTFGTKPLWVAGEGSTQWAVASYSSALVALGFEDGQAKMLPPNSWSTCSLSNLRGCQYSHLREFDLRQFKSSTDDWQAAFALSISKRTQQGWSQEGPKKPVFISLSAGHDSGAIHVELLRQGAGHAAYAVLGPEPLWLMKARALHATKVDPGAGLASWAMLEVSREQFWWEKQWATEFVEPFAITADGRAQAQNSSYAALDNAGAIGISLVCRQGAATGHRVMLSGHGADETMTNYADRGQSVSDFDGRAHLELPMDFAGLYPEQLGRVFPWLNFFQGVNRNYLHTIEVACGAHGVEARYPYLDPVVVQEWLWLTPAAKHAAYKAPIEALLEKTGYPYKQARKVGFDPKVRATQGRWRGRAWARGNVLPPADLETLPPPFVTEDPAAFLAQPSDKSNSLPHVSMTELTAETEVCGHKAVPEFQDFLGMLWHSAAEQGRSDLLASILWGCCLAQTHERTIDSDDCVADLLNMRDHSGSTALLAAVVRGDQSIPVAVTIVGLACSALKSASRRLGVLGVHRNGIGAGPLLYNLTGARENLLMAVDSTGRLSMWTSLDHTTCSLPIWPFSDIRELETLGLEPLFNFVVQLLQAQGAEDPGGEASFLLKALFLGAY